MSATIKEIAESLGISRGTVDRVLHNRGKVSVAVREAVIQKANNLGYTPNKAGRILAARKNPKNIGVLCPSIGNPFFDEVILGMKKATEEYADLGFSLQINEVKGFSPDIHLCALKELAESGVDAILAATINEKTITSFLSSCPFPTAAFNSDLEYSEKLFYVGGNYYQKGELNAGMLMLTAKTKPRIIILRGSERMHGHSQITEGFITRLKTAGFQFDIVGSFQTDDDDDKAETIMKHALASDKDLNTVFITTAGFKGAMKAIDREMLIFTSDDVQDVRDEILRGRVRWTISQEPFRQGYHAVRMMQDYFIDGKKPYDLILENTIKIRESFL